MRCDAMRNICLERNRREGEIKKRGVVIDSIVKGVKPSSIVAVEGAEGVECGVESMPGAKTNEKPWTETPTPNHTKQSSTVMKP